MFRTPFPTCVLSIGALLAGVLLLALPGRSLAQSAPMQAPDTDVAVTSCAGFYLALTSADPGPNPTDKRRAQAKAAQDELFKMMLWVHGYTTGRAGPDARPQPFTSQWVRTNAERLRVICAADDTRATMRIVDAVKQL